MNFGTSLDPQELRSLADIIERLNGDCFEMDAERTGSGSIQEAPRFWPWEVCAVEIISSDVILPRKKVWLRRDPETACFEPVHASPWNTPTADKTPRASGETPC